MPAKRSKEGAKEGVMSTSIWNYCDFGYFRFPGRFGALKAGPYRGLDATDRNAVPDAYRTPPNKVLDDGSDFRTGRTQPTDMDKGSGGMSLVDERHAGVRTCRRPTGRPLAVEAYLKSYG